MISGKAGHGKDTFANMLKTSFENNGKSVIIMHFADLVKHYAYDYYNWNGEKGTSGRALLQYIGTDLMRAHYPTYWAEIIAKFVSAETKWDIALIPDFRFPNEYSTMCKYNKDVHTIRIIRYDKEQIYENPNLTEEQKSHPSECSLDDFEFEFAVKNDGTLTHLQKGAQTLVNCLTSK